MLYEFNCWVGCFRFVFGVCDVFRVIKFYLFCVFYWYFREVFKCFVLWVLNMIVFGLISVFGGF